MHNTWLLLRFAWSAVVIVYCVLAIVGTWRLRGTAKKRNHNILIMMVVLLVIRIAVHRAFGGLAYWLAVTGFGIAAGIAALIVARMLITEKTGDEAAGLEGSEERIQSLKLS